MEGVIYSLGVLFLFFLVGAGVMEVGKWAFRQCLRLADAQTHELANDARPCSRGLRLVK
jgi:hypothetical protein